MILYVLIAFVVYLVLSTVLFPNIGHTQQITKTDYSTFVKALDKKSVDKVEYNTDDYTIYYTNQEENRHGKNEGDQVVGHQARALVGNDRLQRSARLKHAIGKARVIRHTGRFVGDVLVLALLGVINRVIVRVVLDLVDALLIERFDKRRVQHGRLLDLLHQEGRGREHRLQNDRCAE